MTFSQIKATIFLIFDFFKKVYLSELNLKFCIGAIPTIVLSASYEFQLENANKSQLSFVVTRIFPLVGVLSSFCHISYYVFLN